METALLDPYTNAKTKKPFYIKTKKLALKAGESEMTFGFIYCNFFENYWPTVSPSPPKALMVYNHIFYEF